MQLEDRDNAHLWDMLSAARIVGEAARRVSSVTRDLHPEIPWTDIIGQRNILAHEYGQIDYELLYKTATQDVPQLARILEELVPDG